VLLGLRAEAQLIDLLNDIAQVVAALNPVVNLAEDFADLVFNRVRPAGLLLEALQVGKQLPIDEIAQVIAGQGSIVVKLAILALGRRPAFPAIGPVKDKAVLLPIKRGFCGFILL
jgi:hypothetical protein